MTPQVRRAGRRTLRTGPPAGEDLRSELRRLRAEVKRLRSELSRIAPSLETMLLRRGFRVYKKEPAADLLLPSAAFLDRYYRLLHKYSFRLFLRDAIKHQDRFTPELLARYSTLRTVRSYIEGLCGMGLVEDTPGGYRLARRPVLSFGTTLEWYVAEVLRREYGADVLRGVKFRRPRVGGDYDVLAKLGNALFYVEAKSSPPKQVVEGEVAAFLDRVDDLGPESAVFLMDTELRMKDKIVPMFEACLSRRSAAPPSVRRLERELFHADRRVFIVNAKESLARNLGTVIAAARTA